MIAVPRSWRRLYDDRGSSVVEPLVAAVLLVTALAPVGSVFYRVTFSNTADTAVRGYVTAASMADLARADCTLTPPLPTLLPSESVEVTPTSTAGVPGVLVEITGDDDRPLASIAAPCVPPR